MASVAVKTAAPAVVDSTVNVTTPKASDGPEAAEIVSVAPRLEASVTVLPATAVLLVAFKVTVISEVARPFAGNDVGDAVTVELAAEGGAGALKVTVAVCVMPMLSVESVAVKMAEPVVSDFTVKVTTPETSEGPEAAEMVSAAPRLEASVTVLPATGLLLASFKFTVIVEAVTPSAVTDVGDAVTVETPALTAPAVKVTVAVWVTVILSLVSVA